MCLQVPRKVLSVDGDSVIVEGDKKLISKGGISIKPGDFVLPYGNMVVSIIDYKIAIRMRKALVQT